MFKVYLDVSAERVSKLMNEKWVDRLGGADAFSFDNAAAVIEDLRLDLDVLGPFAVQEQ